ncbi:tetratricopeptide repeat protein [Rhodoferax sp.]|uniref:YfgM family protein n=1 Tax=Rhodoferax sp. TaxID=50421 RepID=UPI0025ECAA79|nr:tetratricopeptide repeat protein [Rhodoferax sp.]
MATQLNLEEQEQLDQIKHFWKQYGNAITWVVIVVLGAFASWNLYNYWQRSQAQQAAVLFDEVDRAVQAADAARMERVFSDMKDKFSSTVYAQQSGLLVAREFIALGKPDAAKAALGWVAEKSSDAGYQALARLRLASIAIESKSYDEAMSLLNLAYPASFNALVADRKGDVFILQGDKAKATAEYEKAYRLFDPRTEYRRLVEVKLNALGVDVQQQASVATAVGK